MGYAVASDEENEEKQSKNEPYAISEAQCFLAEA